MTISCFQLRVDGKTVKPFFQSPEVTISKTNDVITISGNGFRVDVDISRDLVVVEVSGWYHNRLGGILGNLNHEKYDDIMTPARKRIDDISLLADAWAVGSKCR